MDFDEWQAGAGILENPYRDAEWLSPNTYVWRTNSEVLTDVVNSFFEKESQIMLIASDYGLGKSTFGHAVWHVISREAAVRSRNVQNVRLAQVEWTELQLYKEVAAKLGRSDGGDRQAVRRRVEEEIESRSRSGIEMLLTVDDSQYLRKEGYHALKYISDLGNGKKHCPVLILGYFNTVAEALKDVKLAQVADRIHLRKTLNLFSQRDVAEYIARTMEWSKRRPLSINYEFPTVQPGIDQEIPKLLPFNLPAY
jgi:type II secretory pathway predicted ATPase ExeA